jgi:glycosyltransferase involved in cell wall biosynthesis
VVIAYNEASTITGCVRALLSQRTTRSIEVVVVDDASTDRTRELVAELAAQDPRVRMVAHRRNLGRGAARRTGQETVDAPLVGYVDADVVVPPDWLERCVSALEPNGAVSGIATPDGDCVVLARLVHPTTRVRAHTLAISGGNVLFDAAALRDVGFEPSERLGEDVRLAHRMGVRGHSIAVVPGLVVQHREAKSYGATVRWMWLNGLDAARLPFELGVLRVPDAAWLGWIVVLVVLVVLAAVGAVPWVAIVGGAVLCTVAVAVAHTASRFRLHPRTLRWLAAAVLDVPLMSAYLAGRTAGFPAALASGRTPATAGPPGPGRTAA